MAGEHIQVGFPEIDAIIDALSLTGCNLRRFALRGELTGLYLDIEYAVTDETIQMDTLCQTIKICTTGQTTKLCTTGVPE